MTHRALLLCLLLPTAWAARPAAAAPSGLPATPACEALPERLREEAATILRTDFPYGCCDDTLAACLEEAPACRVAVREAEAVCRRLKEGTPRPAIHGALAQRERTLGPDAEVHAIDLSAAPAAGEPEAPVALVVYACVRCPYCAQVVPRLREWVEAPPLKGKVRLHLRPFPLKGHPGSVEGAQALAAAAAAEPTRFWAFASMLFERFEAYDVARLPAWAAEAGLERAAFEARYDDPATREALVAAKREGLANGVTATPTLYVAGRQWHGPLDRATVTDWALEVWEAATGQTAPLAPAE